MKGHLLKNYNDKMIDKDAKLFASLRCAYLKNIHNKILNEVVLEVKALYL
jgi:hypothetical protein